MFAPLRTLVGAVMSSLVLVGLVLWFVLTARSETPDSLWLGIVLLLGAGATGLILTVGFRAPATPPDATPEQAVQHACTAFQSSAVRRMAMAEVPAIAALAPASSRLRADTCSTWSVPPSPWPC